MRNPDRAPSSRGRLDGARPGAIDDPALAPVLAALTAAPSERELDGIAPALSALRASRVDAPSTRHPRRRSMLSTLAGAKLGATLTALAVGLGGAATVAYVSADVAATPDAHSTAAVTPTRGASGDHATGRPTTGTPTPGGTAVGPDATGAAAYGLCTAWSAVAGNGKAMDAVAFSNLTTAAGGEDKIEAWCATVTAPGKAGDHATAGDHPTGKPTTAPAGKPSTLPGAPDSTGRPESTPTGKPADVPTPSATSHPSGRS